MAVASRDALDLSGLAEPPPIPEMAFAPPVRLLGAAPTALTSWCTSWSAWTTGPKSYGVLPAAMGAQPGTVDAKGRLAYSHNGGCFIVTKPIDGKPASSANGGTIGFLMSDAKMAETWHKAGVANGGTSIEDPPGVRPNGAYPAYLRDPDGNKIVAVAR